MGQLKSNFKNMVLALSLISAFAALTLGSVYSVTKGPVERSKKAKQESAVREVLPPFARLDEKPERVGNAVGDTLDMYKAYDENGTFVGAAVESTSRKGYAGNIRVMVGFDKEGRIVNYVVLEQKETPGLGTKVVDWFKTANKSQSIIGRNPAQDKLTLSKDGGEIDAITAATISSRAFIDAVELAYNAYVANSSDASEIDAASGATATNHTTAESDFVPAD